MSGPTQQLSIHVEGIQPILSVKDMAASRAFYVDILGFTEEPWGNDSFTSIRHGNGAIYLCSNGQGNPGTWLWIGFHGDIFALETLLKIRGVAIRQAPVNYSWALEMHIEDPDGHILRLGTEPDVNLLFADQ